jgi:hypothetical protein
LTSWRPHIRQQKGCSVLLHQNLFEMGNMPRATPPRPHVLSTANPRVFKMQ